MTWKQHLLCLAAGLGISVAAVPASAKDVYVWLECEANGNSTQALVVSKFFAVEDGAGDEEAAPASDDPDELADQIFSDMSADDDLKQQVLTDYGNDFRAALTAKGWSCVNDLVQAGGPHDTVEDAKTLRDITDGAWIDFRKKSDGVDLDFYEIAFPDAN